MGQERAPRFQRGALEYLVHAVDVREGAGMARKSNHLAADRKIRLARPAKRGEGGRCSGASDRSKEQRDQF
jgi:hypothetical protein